MAIPSNFAALADERFISLTTFRRSGAAVPTPVWVVREDDALLVYTPVVTAKVRRVKRDPSVEMRPCSRRGKVAPAAPTVRGHAEVDDSPEMLTRTRCLLTRKYGLEFRVFSAVEAVAARKYRDRVVLVITPDTSAHTCWPT